jgi:hypothetical protein
MIGLAGRSEDILVEAAYSVEFVNLRMLGDLFSK